MSYLHDLYFDCFQTIKRNSYNSCSIHKPIFSSFHGAVYPVGVTTNRSCFTRIIGHNSLTVHRICTKFDTRIRLWTPFLCAKFQGDRSTAFAFYSNFCKRAKRRRKKNEEKKNEEKNETLAARISEMAGAISFKCGMSTPLVGGQLCSKFGYNRIRDHRDTKIWK